MFGLGLDQLKLYGLAALGIIVTIFIAIFKYRGMKIDKLEKVVEEKKKEIVTRIKAEKQLKDATDAEAKIADVVIDGETKKSNVEKEVDEMMEKSTEEKVPSGL